MPQYKKMKIVVNRKEMETWKVSRTRITICSIAGHCICIKNKGNAVLTNLKRFKNLSLQTKSTLIKTLLTPVLDYPTIRIYAASLTQKRNMQTVVSKEEAVNTCRNDDYSQEGLRYWIRGCCEVIIKTSVTSLNISLCVS